MQVSKNISKKTSSTRNTARYQGKPSRYYKQARENKRNGF